MQRVVTFRAEDLPWLRPDVRISRDRDPLLKGSRRLRGRGVKPRNVGVALGGAQADQTDYVSAQADAAAITLTQGVQHHDRPVVRQLRERNQRVSLGVIATLLRRTVFGR